MGFFKKTQNLINIEPKYQKLLNNLLDIQSKGDNAIFYHSSKINNDLLKILPKKDVKSIFNSKEFEYELESPQERDFVIKSSDCKNLEALLKWAEEVDYKILKKDLTLLKKDFDSNIDSFVEKINSKNSTFYKDWKENINRIQEIYAETGMWPLFIGSCFIKYSNGTDYSFYAPLLLKPVNVFIRRNKVVFQSRENSVIFNEKLLYGLNKVTNNALPNIGSFDSNSLKDAIDRTIETFKKEAKNLELNDDIDFISPLKEYIKNSEQEIFSKVEVKPGVALIVCHPLGNTLREALYSLIVNKKIDNLIKNDYLANHDDEATNEVLEKSKLIRIANTDLTQEKAIVGSLSNSSVIIGPPGTGKSQTIANILVNILENNKKTLFISQKKVALDVVLKRLGDYSNLVFQFFESNKATKYEKTYFYKPLYKFYNQIRTVNTNEEIKKNEEKFFKAIEKEYFEAKQDLVSSPKKDLKAYFNIKKAGDIDPVYEEIKQFYSLFENNFHTRNELKTYAQIFDTKKPIKKKHLSKKLNQYSDEWFKSFTPWKHSKEFRTKTKYAKLITNLFKNKLKNFDVNDFITIGSIINFNTLRKFDLLESEYKDFIDNKNSINITPEQLENMQKRVSSNARKKLEEYKQDNANDEFLNNFLGKISRAETTPSLFVNQYKSVIKDIFNVFVGTPEILANFVDFENDRYDYVIFDESSQIFLEKALPFISIADKVIIAGDSQQMQPTNWFNKRDNEIEDEYSTDKVVSVLDWALQNNFPKFFLEMNYRSNFSELILFSSKEFYESKLKGLDYFNNSEFNSIEVHNTKGSWKDNKNEAEAKKVIELAKSYLNEDKSMIILTFNRKQQDYIRSLIARNEPKLYDKLEDGILLRNLENIQGDEADVVIVSIGYTNDAKLSSTYIGTGSGRNALNVAITRAKDKLVVVKSINSDEIVPNNNVNLMTFKEWLKFLDLDKNELKQYTILDLDTQNKKAKSYFEIEVIDWINSQDFAENIEIVKNYAIGSYPIDLAILNKASRKFLVGISLDDTANSESLEDMLNEKKKNDFIRSKNYPIVRISNFKFDSENNNYLNRLKLAINSKTNEK